MVKTFEVWMSDENWGALNRGLRLLQSLSGVDMLKPVVRELFASKLFYSAAARHAIIKSPLELVLGACRALVPRPNLAAANQACIQLGQAIFAPPTVKGWEGGRLWINSASLLQRNNLATALLDGRFGQTAPLKNRPAIYRELLLARDVPELAKPKTDARQLIHLMLTLPEFQLT